MRKGAWARLKFSDKVSGTNSKEVSIVNKTLGTSFAGTRRKVPNIHGFLSWNWNQKHIKVFFLFQKSECLRPEGTRLSPTSSGGRDRQNSMWAALPLKWTPGQSRWHCETLSHKNKTERMIFERMEPVWYFVSAVTKNAKTHTDTNPIYWLCWAMTTMTQARPSDRKTGKLMQKLLAWCAGHPWKEM